MTKSDRNGRTANRSKRQSSSADVGEQLLAELAVRRVRLQELLRMVRLEVAREMALETASARRACRLSSPRLRAGARQLSF
jgi:hypothetical protein